MARNVAGSKRERRPGVWELRVSVGYREDGSQRSVSRTFRGSETEAELALRDLRAELCADSSLGKTSTISDYWPMFLAQLRAKGVARATIDDYSKSWRLRIEPSFGRMRWSELSFRDVRAWVLTMTHSQAEHAVRTLRRMINCAVDDELVSRNILDHRRIDYPIDPVDPLADDPVMWGAHHVAEAMRRLEGARIEPLWLALVGGGLRPEEGLALWWSEDVSFSDVTRMDGTGGVMAHLRIVKAWTERDGLHGTKNRFSRRVVPVSDPFASRLEELSVQGPRAPLWPLYGGRASKEWRAMFSEGGPLHGMPFAMLKDMRSVHETIAQDAGTLDTVNARLHGRSNITTGYRHYLRPSEALDRAAEVMGERVMSASG